MKSPRKFCTQNPVYTEDFILPDLDKMEHYVVIGYNSGSTMAERVEIIGLYSNLTKAEECVKTENNALYYEMKIIEIKKVDSRIKKNNKFYLGFVYAEERINGLIDGEESNSDHDVASSSESESEGESEGESESD